MGPAKHTTRITQSNAVRISLRVISRDFGTIILGLLVAPCAFAQSLLPNPTPEIYVSQNGNGAEVVPNGQLSFDGKPFTCGKFPTVLDPLLNDYAAAPYKGFIILNPKLMPKVSTPVKLWIYHHECGHVLGIKDEAKADCFSAQRGRRAGWLTLEGLEQVCEFVRVGQANATHQSGVQRCAAMRQCYSIDAAQPNPKSVGIKADGITSKP